MNYLSVSGCILSKSHLCGEARVVLSKPTVAARATVPCCGDAALWALPPIDLCTLNGMAAKWVAALRGWKATAAAVESER